LGAQAEMAVLLGAGREVAEAVGCDEECDQEERIVADVEDVAGDDSARDGASGGENNSYADEEQDLAPAAQSWGACSRPKRVPVMTTPAPMPKLRARTG